MAHRQQARVLINSDVVLAHEVGADGVHLTSNQLHTLTQRPDCTWVAASCHSRDEIALAARLGADFVVLGSVKPTPTHPGAPVLQWTGFEETVRDATLPVYALGGMNPGDLQQARLRGAHGLAMLRGAWR